MTRLWRSFRCLMVLFYLLATPGVMFAHARETSKAEALLQTMSAEEKVSQIFLVTFEGNQVDEDSKIFQLLSKYQIGRVAQRQ